jgi:mxaJ protein
MTDAQKLSWMFAIIALSTLAFADAPVPVLRVCADPDNLPFSNQRREGLENRLAELLARELGAKLEYTWWAQRRGFFRNTIKAGRCDVVLGVPAEIEMVATTRPYYRSSYAFLQRRRQSPRIESFEDPALRQLRIAVQLAGDDGANPPPIDALTQRGIVGNVVGYSLYEARRDGEPALVRDLLDGKVDIAIVWGPLAGHASKRHRELVATPARPDTGASTPLSFSIAVGVKHGKSELLKAIERSLSRRRADIARLLTSYGVPTR